MEIKQPRIAILMAIYEPRMDWLEKQLKSLNAQTYPNISLFIRDDGSPTVPFEEIRSAIQKCITNIPFSIFRNKENLGSNKTFELLTQEANGDYFAYCDQDDIWLPEKLTVLQETIEREHAVLACSDMLVIDAEGRQIADSITKVRKRHVFQSGDHLAPQLIVTNFVTGCTMLIRAGLAKEAIPFCPYMVHDHYLAFYAATKGKIISLPDSLVQYRLHGNNQSAVMAGVHDKESYYQIRIKRFCDRVQWLMAHFRENEKLTRELHEAAQWATARENYFRGEQGMKQMIWNYRHFNKAFSLFEIVAVPLPEKVFMLSVRLIQKGFL